MEVRKAGRKDERKENPKIDKWKFNPVTLIVPGLLIELLYLCYLWFDTGPAQSVIKYMVIYSVVFIVLCIAWFKLKHLEFSRFFLITTLLFSFIFGLTLVTTPPDQSDDIYRYIWDGKLQAFDISPYTYAPDDPVLKPYHSEQLPGLINFPHIKTIYPPAAQLFFRVSYMLFGESVSGMKLLFLLVLLIAAACFYLILKETGSDPRLLLFFAWNPLIVMEVTVNGHLDILMALFLLVFLFFMLKKSWIKCGIALGLAVLSKLIPIILAPAIAVYLLWGNEPSISSSSGNPSKDKLRKNMSIFPNKERIKQALQFSLPLIMTIAGFYILYFKSAENMFATALNYSSKWYFNNPLFRFILSVFEQNEIAHAVSFSLFILVYLVILIVTVAKSVSIKKTIVYTFLAFTLLNPTLHPWYITALLAFLCIWRSPAVILWSGLAVTTYVVVYRYKLTGIWEDSWLLMTIEYLPLLFLSVWGNILKPRPHNRLIKELYNFNDEKNIKTNIQTSTQTNVQIQTNPPT